MSQNLRRGVGLGCQETGRSATGEPCLLTTLHKTLGAVVSRERLRLTGMVKGLG